MRNPDEQQLALECLRLAHGNGETGWEFVIRRAEQYHAFVTGRDADDAKAKLAVVREAVAT